MKNELEARLAPVCSWAHRVPGGLLAPNMVPLNMDGFISCFLHLGIRMGLSLEFRASDVRCLIAGAANPSSSTAIGPLGAHLDPR